MSVAGWWGGLLAALLWAGAATVSPLAQDDSVEKQELLYYPSGKFLKQAALGYEHGVASLTWLRSVQYYGEHVKKDGKFDMMYHLCDVVTDLDPRFEEPYLFGAFVLLTEGQRPREGMKLLDKALEKNPQSWRILFETGFIHYIVWNDYAEASRYFQRAASFPGAPEYAHRFAAFVSYKAGELRTSLLLWQELAERTTNPTLREKAEKKARELTARMQAEGGETR